MATSSPSFSIPKAREAIQKAKGYLEDLFPEHRPFQFEEIRHEKLPSPRWALTFSYRVKDFPFPQYKVVEVGPTSYPLLQVMNR